MLSMLAVSAVQRICHCIKAMVAEGRSELLVVKLSDQWVSDQVRLGNELDLDAEVERVSCHEV